MRALIPLLLAVWLAMSANPAQAQQQDPDPTDAAQSTHITQPTNAAQATSAGQTTDTAEPTDATEPTDMPAADVPATPSGPALAVDDPAPLACAVADGRQRMSRCTAVASTPTSRSPPGRGPRRRRPTTHDLEQRLGLAPGSPDS